MAPFLFGAAAVAVLALVTVRLRRTNVELASVRSELRDSQAALAGLQRASQERLAALDRIPMGILIAESAGEIVYENRAARRLGADAKTQSLLSAIVREVLQGAAEHESAERELVLVGPPPRHIMVQGREMPEGLVAVIEDVSERVRVDSVRRDFVANLSHELKSPLGAMALLAETLVDEQDDDVRQRLLGRMNREALRVGRLVDDLLDLSRLEAGETLHRTDVAVASLVGAAVDEVLPLSQARGVAVKVNSSLDGLVLHVDGQQLSRAVVNLLENAVKYSDDGGLVEVFANVADMNVSLAVRDSGMGIPAEDLERIFERFYRVDRARSRETGGTGLGLAIVRHVMENLGGEVQVASVEGQGSTFSLQFPKTLLRTTGAQ
jgi:two-component system, OmpR family, sensor histidine kinase SenX3